MLFIASYLVFATGGYSMCVKGKLSGCGLSIFPKESQKMPLSVKVAL